MRDFRPVRVSAMYRAQLARGARFRTESGWTIAESYTSPEQELRAAHDGVGLGDASAAARLGVRGAGVERLLASIVGPAAPPRPGRVARQPLDGVAVWLARLAADEVVLLGPAAAGDALAGLLATAGAQAGCAHPTDLTSVLAVIDLVGPRAPSLLARVTPLDLATLDPDTLAHTAVCRAPTTLIRVAHPALPVYRLLFGREHGEFLWHALAEAGHDLGLAPQGAAAQARLWAEG